MLGLGARGAVEPGVPDGLPVRPRSAEPDHAEGGPTYESFMKHRRGVRRGAPGAAADPEYF